MMYCSGSPISGTLNFSNLPITGTKSHSLFSIEHCNFYPGFLEHSNFSKQCSFPLAVRKIGIAPYSGKKEEDCHIPFHQDALFPVDLVSFCHLNWCFLLGHSAHFSLHLGNERFVLIFHCYPESCFCVVGWQMKSEELAKERSVFYNEN